MCGVIDLDTYELNPNDPDNGGNHNHKGFSVYVINDTVWAGTANGINKGIIDSDCINWDIIIHPHGIIFLVIGL